METRAMRKKRIGGDGGGRSNDSVAQITHPISVAVAATDFLLTQLNDDTLTEVFLRLPNPATLACCSYVSKHHLPLISHPSFPARYHGLHPGPPPMIGAFQSDFGTVFSRDRLLD